MARGRPAKPIAILGSRDLTEEEVSRPRGSIPAVSQIRDIHHNVARAFAAGFSNNEVARMLGYSISRVSLFRKDPAIGELTAHYRDRETVEVYAEQITAVNQMIEQGRVAAVRELCTRLVEDGESMSNRELLGAIRELGPKSSGVQVNVNLGLAERLEAALLAAKEVQASRMPKLIEAEPLSSSTDFSGPATDFSGLSSSTGLGPVEPAE